MRPIEVKAYFTGGTLSSYRKTQVKDIDKSAWKRRGYGECNKFVVGESCVNLNRLQYIFSQSKVLLAIGSLFLGNLRNEEAE